MPNDVRLSVKITDQEYLAACKLMRTRTLNEKQQRRLQALMLRYEGLNNKEIAQRLGFTHSYIAVLMRTFRARGMEDYLKLND